MGQQQPKDLRIVLVGKTGVGKSAAGNTILGREEFVSDIFAASVTKECAKESAKVKHRKVAVIDTPGLFDTELSNEEVMKEIIKCICLSAPGPHAILVVIQIGRFTREEQDTVEIIQETFGDDSAKYTIVLFTYGDKLKREKIDKFLDGNKKLKAFTDQCSGRVHVFNNEDKDPSQVLELIKKIDKMVATNGGGCYTNDMYKKAEKAIEEKKKAILKENPGISETIARAKAETQNSFINSVLAGAAGGVAGGAAVGAVGGPVGSAVGAAVGAGVGAAVGVVIAASKKCSIQ